MSDMSLFKAAVEPCSNIWGGTQVIEHLYNSVWLVWKCYYTLWYLIFTLLILILILSYCILHTPPPP